VVEDRPKIATSRADFGRRNAQFAPSPVARARGGAARRPARRAAAAHGPSFHPRRSRAKRASTFARAIASKLDV